MLKTVVSDLGTVLLAMSPYFAVYLVGMMILSLLVDAWLPLEPPQEEEQLWNSYENVLSDVQLRYDSEE